MESEAASSPSSQLSDLKRAEILTHTRYPKLGSWYPPLFGFAAAAWVAAYALPTWGSLLVWVALAAAGGALVQKYLAMRGATPDPKQAPEPIKREMKIFFALYTLVIAMIVATFLAISWWASSIVAFTTFTAVIAVYEQRCAKAAHQVEVDAGITT